MENKLQITPENVSVYKVSVPVHGSHFFKSLNRETVKRKCYTSQMFSYAQKQDRFYLFNYVVDFYSIQYFASWIETVDFILIG